MILKGKAHRMIPVTSIGIYCKKYYALRPIMYLYDSKGWMLGCVKVPSKDIFSLRSSAPGIHLQEFI